ncbi:CBS domain-containing protein [Nocardia sp. NPDC001965]
MRARHTLGRPVVTVRRDTPLPEAMPPLTAHGFATLPVVDDQEQVVGIQSRCALATVALLLRRRIRLPNDNLGLRPGFADAAEPS